MKQLKFNKGEKYVNQHGDILEFIWIDEKGVYVFFVDENKFIRYFGEKCEPIEELEKFRPLAVVEKEREDLLKEMEEAGIDIIRY